MASTAENSRASRIETGLTALVAVVLAWPFWRPDRYFAGFDTVAYSGPNHQFTVSEWKAGRLPLWNDRIFGGVAHLGNTQTGVLYPVRLLFAGFGTNRALDLMIATHLVAMALGMLWLARRLGLRPPAGFVVGVGGVANGASLVRSIQFEQFLALAWAPFLVIGVHAVITSRRPWRAAALLALSAAATITAGHPQLIYLDGSFALCFGLGTLLTTRAWRRLVPLGAAGLAAALLSSLQLLATTAAYSPSALKTQARADLRRPDWTLTPGRLVEMLLGTTRDISPDRFLNAFEIIGSVGVTLLLLAAVGLVAVPRVERQRSLVVTIFVGGVVSTIFAMGDRSFVFRLAYAHLPGFSAARVPARWLTMTALCLVVLAGFGVDAIARGAFGRRELRSPFLVGALLLLATATGLAQVDLGRRTAAMWILVAAPAVAALVWGHRQTARRAMWAAMALTLLTGAELGVLWLRSSSMRLLHDHPFEGYTASTTESLRAQAGWTIALTDQELGSPEYLVPGLRPNANVFEDVALLDGYDGGVQITRRWQSLILRGMDTVSFDLPMFNQLHLPLSPAALGRMNVRWVLLSASKARLDHVAGWTGPLISDDRFSVYENPAWIGDAVLWPDSQPVADPIEAATRLRTDLASLRATALVEARDRPVSCSGTCTAEPAELVRHNARDLSVHTASEHAAVLSVGAQYDSGWEVTVDGARAEALAVDGFFLGTVVPPGEHEVRFLYRPGWVPMGVALTGVGVLSVVALAWTDRRSRHAVSASSAEPTEESADRT